MTGPVSRYAPRNACAATAGFLRVVGGVSVGIGFAFSAGHEIAAGLDRAVGARAVGARLRRWRWRWHADRAVSAGWIASSVGRIADPAGASGDDSQHRRFVRKRRVQPQPGSGSERRLDPLDELDGKPSRAGDERRNTCRDARAGRERDDDRWRQREFPLYDTSEHGRQHQRIVGSPSSG